MKILIVIPTLNEVKSLTSIIKKIKYQKIDLKILFVDDNSNDGTQQLIKSISKKDKNIRNIQAIKLIIKRLCKLRCKHKPFHNNKKSIKHSRLKKIQKY